MIRLFCTVLILLLGFTHLRSQDEPEFPACIDLIAGRATGTADRSVLNENLQQILDRISESNFKEAEELWAAMDSFPQDTVLYRDLGIFLDWVQTYSSEKTPLFPYFNGSYTGFYLKERSIPLDSVQKARKAMENAAWTLGALQQLLPEHQPLILEALGDLMVRHPNRASLKYLAALSYLGAARSLDNDAAADGYRRKAIFAMEGIVRDDEYYNIARYRALIDSLDAESSVKSAFKDLISKKKKDIDWWPSQMDIPTAQFTLLHVSYDKMNEGRIPTHDDLINPSVDPDSVKGNRTFNTYAIGIIAILIFAVAVIWIRFSRATKKMEESDE